MKSLFRPVAYLARCLWFGGDILHALAGLYPALPWLSGQSRAMIRRQYSQATLCTAARRQNVCPRAAVVSALWPVLRFPKRLSTADSVR